MKKEGNTQKQLLAARLILDKTKDYDLCMKTVGNPYCERGVEWMVARDYPNLQINWAMCNDKGAVLPAIIAAGSVEGLFMYKDTALAGTGAQLADAVNAACKMTPVAKTVMPEAGKDGR